MAAEWTEKDHDEAHKLIVWRRNSAQSVFRHLDGRYSIEDIQQRFAAEIKNNNDRRKASRARCPRGIPTLFALGRMVTEAQRPEVPAWVEEERQMRLSAPPRDLSGLMFGDPPLGFSALEKRT